MIDPWSAGTNLRSTQSDLTPWILTLVFVLNLIPLFSKCLKVPVRNVFCAISVYRKKIFVDLAVTRSGFPWSIYIYTFFSPLVFYFGKKEIKITLAKCKLQLSEFLKLFYIVLNLSFVIFRSLFQQILRMMNKEF